MTFNLVNAIKTMTWVLVATLLIAGAAIQANAHDPGKGFAEPVIVEQPERTVKFSPEDRCYADHSAQCRVTRIPDASLIIIGGHWNCRIQNGHELCRFKVTACDDDESGLCVSTPLASSCDPEKYGPACNLTDVPVADMVPLIIGTYWDCIGDRCDIRLVACDDDDSGFCVAH